MNGTKKWITGGMCPEVFSVGGVVWKSNGFMMVGIYRLKLGVVGVVPPHLQCNLLPKPSFGVFLWCRSNGVCQLLLKKKVVQGFSSFAAFFVEYKVVHCSNLFFQRLDFVLHTILVSFIENTLR